MVQYMWWLVAEEQALLNLLQSKQNGVWLRTMIMDMSNLQHLIIRIYCSNTRRAGMGRFMTLLKYPGTTGTF